jgi:hypothetical protein
MKLVMISLSHLNKLILLVLFFSILNLNLVVGEEEPIDIWKKSEGQNESNNKDKNEEEIKIESPILSDTISASEASIDESKILNYEQDIIGIIDPEKNNFNLSMWSKTDGEDIKKVLKRIEKIKLSKVSEEFLFQALFTNAYAPEKNLTSDEFLNIKIDWLINKKRIKDLENFLEKNPEAGKSSKAIKFLTDEYLSSANIKSACEKVSLFNQRVENDYLEKFKIYCLIKNDQKEEAQLIFDLLLEKGFKDSFFENKINYLLGIEVNKSTKILDNNLFNFYLSYVTNNKLEYQPNENTDPYIWKYLSSANLIKVNNFEDEDIILTYEQAAAQNSFNNKEIFKIYLKMNFNFNQLANSEEIYKTLPSYKSRALIYQSLMLSDNVERKIRLAFLLKDLFANDKISSVYSEELSEIFKNIDREKIPDSYLKLVDKNLNKSPTSKIKFDNEILHRSKVIKHFLENNERIKKTEKDFRAVYKKIKKNKKYFISIKDVVVLESLEADGISLPADLDYKSLSSNLTVPKDLYNLAIENQLGLVMLKIVEIIGEDNITDLDPETIYFINKILNELNLKKIRNDILSHALPVRV